MGIETVDTYFNAGVLCLNLTQIRKSRLPQRANYITRKSSGIKHWLHDQTILNLIYGKEVLTVPYSYNTFIKTWLPIEHNIKEAVGCAKILHLLGSKNNIQTKESVFAGFKKVYDYIMQDHLNELRINFQKCAPTNDLNDKTINN